MSAFAFLEEFADIVGKKHEQLKLKRQHKQ